MQIFSDRMKRGVEFAANIVIILAGLLFAVKLIKPDLLPATGGQAFASPGSRLSLPAVDWSTHDRTLVLALRRGCHFCSESAPFYQRLADAAKQSKRIHLMAVLPQTPADGRKYLEDLGVSIADIRQAQLREVEGTPTLLLLDRKGVVKNVWVGKLSSDRETDVLSKIGL